MRYTVHELEKMKFPLRLRGYDRREVDRVMLEVARQTEELLAEVDRLKGEIKRLEERLAQYQNMEDSLQKSLLIAQQTMEEKIAQANREAESIIRDARRHEGEVRQEIARLEALRDQLVLEIHGLLARFLTQLRGSYPELVQRADEIASLAPPAQQQTKEAKSGHETGPRATYGPPLPSGQPAEPTEDHREASPGLPREEELPSMVPPEPPAPQNRSEEGATGGGKR